LDTPIAGTDRKTRLKTENGERNDMRTITVFKHEAIQKKALLKGRRKEPKPWGDVWYKPKNTIASPGKEGTTA
jgi:hypothetical protein